MRLVLFAIFWVMTGAAAFAQAYTCEVCDKLVTFGTIYYLPGKNKTNYFCGDCKKLPDRCTICALPAGPGLHKMSDGRSICRKDIDKVILDEPESERIFHEVSRQVSRMANGGMELRGRNLSVKLFAVPFWMAGDGASDKMHMHGVAVSPLRNGEFFHNVNLLSGVLKTELAATAAHEFMHLWINENRPEGRKISKDTVEALCEMISYKYAVLMGDTEQQEEIKKNPYTKGEVLKAIEYERIHGLEAVLQWVKAGKDENFDQTEAAQPAPTPAAPPPFFAPAPVAKEIPKTLVLRGLLGNGKRRMAMINDRTFEKSETAKMQVGDKTVLVEVVDILEDAVIIRVDKAAETITLPLN